MKAPEESKTTPAPAEPLPPVVESPPSGDKDAEKESCSKCEEEKNEEVPDSAAEETPSTTEEPVTTEAPAETPKP
jgi:hypothetical protein